MTRILAQWGTWSWPGAERSLSGHVGLAIWSGVVDVGQRLLVEEPCRAALGQAGGYDVLATTVRTRAGEWIAVSMAASLPRDMPSTMIGAGDGSSSCRICRAETAGRPFGMEVEAWNTLPVSGSAVSEGVEYLDSGQFEVLDVAGDHGHVVRPRRRCDARQSPEEAWHTAGGPRQRLSGG